MQGRITDLFRKSRELFGGATLLEIIAILKSIADIGLPPGIEDKEELRKWVTDLGVVFGEIADKTTTTIDDSVASFCLKVVANDDAWDICYAVMKILFAGGEPDFEYANRMAFAMVSEGDAPQFDPLTVLAIIKMIVDIIKMFRRED